MFLQDYDMFDVKKKKKQDSSDVCKAKNNPQNPGAATWNFFSKKTSLHYIGEACV